mmetsp:Transcript_98280/g.184792  ORF Transcript_98280/g.184792 Transcript_98280/m.184792 type:complete len:243 (+) Transcript_98280:80-808(+)
MSGHEGTELPNEPSSDERNVGQASDRCVCVEPIAGWCSESDQQGLSRQASKLMQSLERMQKRYRQRAAEHSALVLQYEAALSESRRLEHHLDHFKCCLREVKTGAQSCTEVPRSPQVQVAQVLPPELQVPALAVQSEASTEMVVESVADLRVQIQEAAERLHELESRYHELDKATCDLQVQATAVTVANERMEQRLAHLKCCLEKAIAKSETRGAHGNPASHGVSEKENGSPARSSSAHGGG